MPKIKRQPVSLDPRTPSLSIADPNPRQGRIIKARPQRVFDSGKGILADALSEFGRGVGNFAKYLANKEAKILETEASDYLVELSNTLNERYVADIASKRSGSAKDLFKQEVVLTQEGKEVFLEQAGEDTRLQQMLSIGYDSITQKHLQKVLKHKLDQDEVYIKDVAYKVAKNLQTEMTNLRIEESKKAVTKSNQMDEQLKDYPVLRKTMKIEAWRGLYKFNARVNPDLTQEIYEHSGVRQSIVNQIGFNGYSSIQESIDTGRRIKLQNEQIAKIQVAEKKSKDVEKVMDGAITTYIKTPEKFNGDLIDSLKLSSGERLPTQEKRILLSYLSSLTKGKILTEAEVDYSVYAELLELTRLGKAADMRIGEVQNRIIGSMNRSITNSQGSALLKALSNRDIFDTPVVQAAFDKLENMYKEEGDFDSTQYISLVHSLFDTIIRYDGDPKKVQEYLQDVVEPAARRSWWANLGKNVQPEFDLQAPIRPYMSDQEEEAIVTLLAEKNQKTKKGVTVTIDMINDELLISYLEFVRSNEYIKKQNLKKQKIKIELDTDIMQ